MSPSNEVICGDPNGLHIIGGDLQQSVQTLVEQTDDAQRHDVIGRCFLEKEGQIQRHDRG